MGDCPDPSAFSVIERPNEYQVRCRVEGEITLTINAESLADARTKAEEMAEKNPEEFEAFDPDDIRISYVYKSPAMYRVTRDGQAMQVSRLEAGDLPRDPDPKSGF
jgi:hypothetical protein